MPVLGATESTTVVLAAAICLWGDVMLFSRYLVDPYVQYEMQQDADGPEEEEQGAFDGAGCGQDAPLVDPADMLQFGFTLSQVTPLNSRPPLLAYRFPARCRSPPTPLAPY